MARSYRRNDQADGIDEPVRDGVRDARGEVGVLRLFPAHAADRGVGEVRPDRDYGREDVGQQQPRNEHLPVHGPSVATDSAGMRILCEL